MRKCVLPCPPFSCRPSPWWNRLSPAAWRGSPSLPSSSQAALSSYKPLKRIIKLISHVILYNLLPRPPRPKRPSPWPRTSPPPRPRKSWRSLILCGGKWSVGRFSDTVLPIPVNRFLSHLVLSDLFRFEEVLAWLFFFFFFCLFLSYRSNKNGRGLMERGGGEGNERGGALWEMRVLSRKKSLFRVLFQQVPQMVREKEEDLDFVIQVHTCPGGYGVFHQGARE